MIASNQFVQWHGTSSESCRGSTSVIGPAMSNLNEEIVNVRKEAACDHLERRSIHGDNLRNPCSRFAVAIRDGMLQPDSHDARGQATRDRRDQVMRSRTYHAIPRLASCKRIPQRLDRTEPNRSKQLASDHVVSFRRNNSANTSMLSDKIALWIRALRLHHVDKRA